MTSSLVGSEMCIRDRTKWLQFAGLPTDMLQIGSTFKSPQHVAILGCPVSYTHLTLPTICSV
eukprot:5752146-Prorocentrum_lima.AAC.1